MVESDDEDQDIKAQRRTNLWFSKVKLGIYLWYQISLRMQIFWDNGKKQFFNPYLFF